MSNENVSTQPQTPERSTSILDSIRERASQLPPLNKEEAPVTHTMEVKKPEVKEVTSEIKLGEESEEGVEEVEAPVAVTEPATDKIKNELETKAVDSITNELDADDLDDDTREYVSEVYGNKGPVIKKDATPEDVQEKYKPFIDKANEYEAILSDPMTKAFIEFRRNGGQDPNEFIKQTGIADVAKMTPEQLYEASIQGYDLTDDEKVEAMEKFGELDKIEKLQKTKSIKEELVRNQNEKLKTFSGQNEAIQKVVAEATKQGTAELNTLLDKMIGKKYKGLEIASEMAETIRHEVIQNPVNKYDENGKFIGFDISESIRRAVILNFDAQRSKSLIELGKTMGADKALTARVRPNKKEVSAAVVPVTHKTLEDTRKNFAEKQWEQRGVKKK